MRQIIARAALLLMLPALATAQNTDHRPRGLAYVFVGAGTHQMGLTAGFAGEGYVYRGLGMGLEVGTAGVGTAANGNPNMIGVGSTDASYHFFSQEAPGQGRAVCGRRLHKFLRARRLSAVPGAPVSGKFCTWL